MQISNSALQYGIDWSPIYSTRAIRELRSKDVLKGATAPCSDLPGAVPAWHPMIGFQDFQNAIKCSPLSLRAKADPFQWTQVDPDCGKLSGAVTNSCKHRDTKFVIEEITRSSSGNGGGL